ncbi:zinc ribbon domain-containing protein [Halocella sp. SP3-1]|uniref:zinc ribbon domain-containing protein n=1 Tax=Halocella sp. SP3-1 TaxID=2382161 RepID=UPI000F75E5AA|nr:zinc ribbon domain-containing protein [Halocella sp. SP3-1]AZO94910.1 zinc ribbon domain-containing protein [Halocella sp. SP3-1]
MKCQNCGNELKNSDKFCSNCGSELKKDFSSFSNKGNKNNNAVGVGNTILNNVGEVNVNNYSEQKIKDIKYEIASITPLFNVKKMKIVGIISSIIGVLPTLVSLFGLINKTKINISDKFSSYMLILLAFGSLLIILNMILKRRGFEKIRFFAGKAIYLKLLDNDKVAILKIAGKCPTCGANINLMTDKNNDTYGICERNPQQHIFGFDHTSL